MIVRLIEKKTGNHFSCTGAFLLFRIVHIQNCTYISCNFLKKSYNIYHVFSLFFVSYTFPIAKVISKMDYCIRVLGQNMLEKMLD